MDVTDTTVEYLSPEKYEDLKAELSDLQTVKRREVTEQLEFAKSMGDLSENAEYHAARALQGEYEDRIRELEEMLRRAVVMSSKNRTSDIVQAGATVELKKKGARSTKTYLIVGSEESDVSAGKISYRSPIGSGAMGKRVGEEFIANTPRGEVTYTVVTIK